MITILFHTQKIHAHNSDRRPSTLTECSSLNFTGHFTQDFFSWRNNPYWARAFSLFGLQEHTWTHHTCQHSSGRVMSPSQGPLPDNTQHSQKKNTSVTFFFSIRKYSSFINQFESITSYHTFYSPPNAQVVVLKTILKFTVK